MVEDKVQTAEEQLISMADGDPERAAILLEALEEKRRRESFCRYWQPQGDEIKLWQMLKEKPNAKVWLILGGERSGKTAIASFLATAWLLGKMYFKGEPAEKWVAALPIPEGPTKVWGVGLSNEMTRGVMWQEKLVGGHDHPPLFPRDGSVIKESEHELIAVFKNGSRFEGKTAEAEEEKFRSAAVDLVWLDEECRKSIFDQCYQRTVSRGGKLIVSATPKPDAASSSEPWLFDAAEKAVNGDPDYAIMYMDVMNNPSIPDKEKEGLWRKWGGTPEEGMRLRGEFIQRAGLVYPMWRATPPMWIEPYEIPRRDITRVVMLDPASSGPVGCLWAAYTPDGKMTLFKEYKEKGLTPREHVENILALNGGDPINQWLCDPWYGPMKMPWHKEHGDERTVLDIFRDAGLHRLRLATMNDDVALEESRDYLRAAGDSSAPHPPVEVFNTLKLFRSEIERYTLDSVAQGARRGEVRDRPKKGNDDLMQCFRFLSGMRIRHRDIIKVKLVEPEYR